MEESLRWFGPNDPVPLSYLRQAGATGVFSALHEIPYGEAWPIEAIRERRQLIESAGLRWNVAESVPIHEDIKVGEGDLTRLFNNYTKTLRNLAAEGIRTIIYNFMPVLDWVRTDMRFTLPNGAQSLRFDPIPFAAFEIHALKRKNAKADYTPEQQTKAAQWWNSLTSDAQKNFIQTIIDVFPGCKLGLSLDQIRAMLARYHHITAAHLTDNLARFLNAVLPTAEEAGTRLAIHPDDPPFSIIGLPRIVSTADQLEKIFSLAPSPANGLCLCTGSLSARPDNDIPAIIDRFAPRIHAVHLRSTQRNPDGSFHEADHLAGSLDMPKIVQLLLHEQDRRAKESHPVTQLPFRPDHGHNMMDDLQKPLGITPGYSAIGRMKGLAELRGLMRGLMHPR